MLEILLIDFQQKELKPAGNNAVKLFFFKKLFFSNSISNVGIPRILILENLDNPIAKLIPGSDYLNPQIHLIIDDMIEYDEKLKLNKYLQKWVNEKIKLELKSLLDLKNIKENNSELRALSYHLYENNGVVKREEVSNYLNKLNQDERKKLRRIGVKFGRYHIFLFKLFKPSSVSLRILLWKSFNEKNLNLLPPTFGLNFLEEKEKINKDFMLLCGFEKFSNFFVRIDILERLFILILNSNKEKNNEIKLVPEMLNLLGSNKDNFIKLLQSMGYKIYKKEKEVYFKYVSNKKINRNKSKRNDKINNPFGILSQLNLK